MIRPTQAPSEACRPRHGQNIREGLTTPPRLYSMKDVLQNDGTRAKARPAPPPNRRDTMGRIPLDCGGKLIDSQLQRWARGCLAWNVVDEGWYDPSVCSDDVVDVMLDLVLVSDESNIYPAVPIVYSQSLHGNLIDGHLCMIL